MGGAEGRRGRIGAEDRVFFHRMNRMNRKDRGLGAGRWVERKAEGAG